MANLFKITLTVLLSLSLQACALLDFFMKPPEKEERTLANLQSKELKFRNAAVEEVKFDDVITKYHEFLKVSDDPEMNVRVHHRIANLRLQKDEEAWESTDEDLDAISMEDIGRQSIKDYSELLAKFPDRSDNDIALYQLAKAYNLSGESLDAIDTLQKLVDDYPRSAYYLESLFRIAELNYSNGLYEESEIAYQALIDYGEEDNKYYQSSRYLIGWSQFKQEEYDKSLRSFASLIDAEFPTEDDLLSVSTSQKTMLDDVLRIMVITFNYQGDWTYINKFFESYGHRYYEYLMYDKMASMYYEKGFYKSGASTLRAFVTLYPNDVLAPNYYERLITGYKKARYPTLERKHKKGFIERFGKASEYWVSHGTPVQAVIEPLLDKYIWDLARFNHAWGQRQKSRKEKNARLNEAIQWYQEYITSFPEGKDVAKAHFLLAEVAYETKQFELAKDNYEIVAYQYPDYEKASEAGYAAVVTYSRHKPKDKKKSKEWRQLTVASAMRFVQEFPEDDRRGLVLVNTSEMMLEDKLYQQALDTARLAWSSKGLLSEKDSFGAALVRSHSSYQLEHFPEAETAILEALKYPKITTATKKDLRLKLAASIYKQGEIAKNSGQSEEAIRQWLRVGNVVPESGVRRSAEYDAGTLLMAEKQYQKAIDVFTTYRRNYPKDKFIKNIPSKLIVAYEGLEQWGKAADELMVLSATNPDKEQRRIALYQSAEYYEKAKDTEKALNTYKDYAHKYKRPFDPAIEAHNKLAQMYADKKDNKKRFFWLNKIIWLNKGAKKNQTERSKYLAAAAAYELGDHERKIAEGIRIKQPLAKSIQRKNRFMQAAIDRYTQSVQLGVLEYTTSSTYRIANLYHGFSKSLMKSERPKGLDELELEEYEELLEDQAFPLEEAAIDVHQTNINRTYDGLYDNWIKDSYKSLADLMPGEYAKFEKRVAYVDAIR